MSARDGRGAGRSRQAALAALVAAGLGLTVPAAAEDAVTVTSLLRQDFAIAGTLSATGGGAGLFLQKKDRLYFCFLTETRDSGEVATQYCKPVK